MSYVESIKKFGRTKTQPYGACRALPYDLGYMKDDLPREKTSRMSREMRVQPENPDEKG